MSIKFTCFWAPCNTGFLCNSDFSFMLFPYTFVSLLPFHMCVPNINTHLLHKSLDFLFFPPIASYRAGAVLTSPFTSSFKQTFTSLYSITFVQVKTLVDSHSLQWYNRMCVWWFFSPSFTVFIGSTNFKKSRCVLFCWLSLPFSGCGYLESSTWKW